MTKEVNVIGAGLAGSEACYQLLKRGYNVNLFEMKPNKFSAAHKNKNFAELVCSNSLKSNDVTSACGLLKQELRMLDSLVINVADNVSVPAGSALAVDRELFSQNITDKLKSFENLNVINTEIESFDLTKPTIVATGPLTSDSLAQFLKSVFNDEYLYFFDAIAPIVGYDGIDFDSAFVADRYDKGTGDYINCPMNKEEYELFYNELVNAESVKLKDFENSKVFEGCMPVEVLAKRGVDALRFGPLKPVGLTDPKTGRYPYACVQLRRETNNLDMFNMVGFQTNLTFKEQERVFKLIPALKNAEFLRFGVMHRNTFINAPTVLNRYFQVKEYPNVFIAGQLSGVEGYVESIAGGLLCALNMDRYLNNLPLIDFTNHTMIGALSNYIEAANPKHFQPMASNMGILNGVGERIKDKKEKYKKLSDIALNKMSEIINENSIN